MSMLSLLCPAALAEYDKCDRPAGKWAGFDQASKCATEHESVLYYPRLIQSALLPLLKLNQCVYRPHKLTEQILRGGGGWSIVDRVRSCTVHARRATINQNTETHTRETHCSLVTLALTD